MFEKKIEFVNEVMAKTMELNKDETKVSYSPQVSLYADGSIILGCMVYSMFNKNNSKHIQMYKGNTELYFKEIEEAKTKVVKEDRDLAKNRKSELLKELSELENDK